MTGHTTKRSAFTVAEEIPEYYMNRVNRQFPMGFVIEGNWRRTQVCENRVMSGWTCSTDRRRKLIYHLDRYDFEKTRPGRVNLTLASSYYKECLTAPHGEIEEMEALINDALEIGCWNVHRATGDEIVAIQANFGLQLNFCLRKYDRHPEDHSDQNMVHRGYRTLEMTFGTEGAEQALTEQQRLTPWRILQLGLRRPTASGTPRVALGEREIQGVLAGALPAQLEIGAGPSIEAGIAPLCHQHMVYGVQSHERFLLKPSDSSMLCALANSLNFFCKSTTIPAQAIMAAPEDTDFYRNLGRLYRDGLFVGDLLSNNFDGITNLIPGVITQCVRRYDAEVPTLRFHPAAKSLIVVGVHADRRGIQAAARSNGLRVIYVDPETVGGIQYPLEATSNDDVLIRMGASEFIKIVGGLVPEHGLLSALDIGGSKRFDSLRHNLQTSQRSGPSL